jgi:hypothetical protein
MPPPPGACRPRLISPNHRQPLQVSAIASTGLEAITGAMRLHFMPPLLGELFPALKHIEISGPGEVFRDIFGLTDPADRPSQAEIESFGLIAIEGRLPFSSPVHRRAPTPERVREGRFNAPATARDLDRETYSNSYAVSLEKNDLRCRSDGWLDPFTSATIGPTAPKDGLDGGPVQIVANPKKVARGAILCDYSPG